MRHKIPDQLVSLEQIKLDESKYKVGSEIAPLFKDVCEASGNDLNSLMELLQKV